jgi:hypothetical protein
MMEILEEEEPKALEYEQELHNDDNEGKFQSLSFDHIDPGF